MWDRRSYLESCFGQRCTVKFEGYIPPWKDTLALGVEWDDASRGRNNGCLDGIEYFACDVPNAGSFIKASRPAEKKLTLEEALNESYLTLDNATQTSFGVGKDAEMLGFDKTHARQHDLNQLEVVSVIMRRVYSLECSYSLANLRQLELNDNLFSDFGVLVRQLSEFKKLTTLYLNGNRMQYTAAEPNYTVTELSMVRTLIPQNKISCVYKAFPNLKTLNLAENRLVEFPTFPPHLKVLDLSSNLIKNVHFKTSQLDTLILSDNPVNQFSVETDLPNTLDLRGCAFSWDRVSLIGAKSVKSLSFMHAENALEYRLFAIARCPYIRMLDGTPISEDERGNAEMYTLNMVARKKHPDLPPQVWQALLSKHGAPKIPMNRSIQSRLLRFYINNDPNPYSIVEDVPVYRLFMLVARILNIGINKLEIAGISEHLPDLLTSTVIVSDYLDDGSKLEIKLTSK